MTARSVWIYVALVVGAFGLVAGLGYDERARQDGEPGALERLLIGEQRPGTSYSVAISFNPETGVWRAGERTWRSGPMAKTQVTDYDTVTCTVQIPGILPLQSINGHPASYIQVTYGPALIAFVRGEVTSHDGEDYYLFYVHSGEPPFGEFFGTIEVPADGNLHDYAISLEVPVVLTTTCADDPISDKSAATHAKERTATDSWVFPSSGTYKVTALGITQNRSWSGTVTRALNLYCSVEVWSGNPSIEGEQDYAVFANLSFNGAPVDASLCNEEFEPTITGGSNTPENVWARGSGSSIRVMQDDYVGTSLSEAGVLITPPIVHSFTGLHVTDMDGADLSDLVIWFTGAQWYDATEEAWAYRGYTLAEWQALTLVPNYGLYSWDPQPPPDGALRTLATAAFYIDRDSARTHQLDGFAEPEEA